MTENNYQHLSIIYIMILTKKERTNFDLKNMYLYTR